jgi:flavin-dependent dehydrogenase
VPRALVKGRGVAGLTIGRRLGQAGWKVDIVGRPIPPGRIVTLDASVSALLDLEFGKDLIGQVAHHVLEERIISWSRSTFEVVNGRILVFDISRITAAIEANLSFDIELADVIAETTDVYDVMLDATGRSSTPLLSSGARTAFSWLLSSSHQPKHAFLGASDLGGWVFVAPAPRDRLLIQAVTPGQPGAVEQPWTVAADLLASTGMPAAAEAIWQTPAATADATPIFSHPVTQDGVLRVGDRAAAGDPLAGDGVGRAVRSAILAAAVVLDASHRRGAALSHYASRVAAAHAVHLRTTASFYADSICAVAFAPAIDSMRRHARLLDGYAMRLAQPVRVVARPNAVQLIRTA